MTSPRSATSRRTRDLAAIHASVKQLEMDRPTYEMMLMHLVGVRSCADLNDAGRAKVLAELRAKLQATDKNKGRPKNISTEPMVAKIGALLAEIGAPWAYADKIAQHMFGIAFVAWVRRHDQLRAIIASLDARRKKLQDLGELPKRRRRKAGAP